MVVTSFHHRIRDRIPSPNQSSLDKIVDIPLLDEGEEQIGFNENKAALKSQIQANMSAKKFFKNSKRLFGQVEYDSDLPSREMYQELRRSDSEFERVTNVTFDAASLPYEELELDQVSSSLLPFFSHRLDNEDFSVYFEHSSDPRIIFHVLSRSPQYVSGLKIAFEHYVTLLSNIEADIEKPIKSLTLFSDSSRNHAIQLADGGPLKEEARNIIDSFYSIAALRPKDPAVSYMGTKISYSQLADSAKLIAHALSLWVAEEAIVGICLSRGEAAIQAMFGVLFSGGAYLPLDPKMPAERLAFIAQDSKLSAVIVDYQTRHQIQPLVNCPVLIVEELLSQASSSSKVLSRFPVQVPSNRAAYVIYTSGTTGKPKGVVLERGMVAHYVAAMEGVCGRGPGCRWLQFASLNFDASVLEIFNSLTHGAELVVVPEEVRVDPDGLFTFLKDEQITHACLPPAILLLLPRKPLPDLKGLFLEERL